MRKVTFVFDAKALRHLESAVERHKKPKSAVMREAIAEFDLRSDRMSEAERQAKLKALDEYLAQPSTKTRADVDRELAEIRRARRHGGRRHRAE